ncbi:hypothetical protein FF80_02417 [Devosia sp. LC5]|nr:hypothetical protein FF80_02417 [Devosia sp. LC5]
MVFSHDFTTTTGALLGLDPRITPCTCRAENGPRVEPEGDAVGVGRAEFDL